MNQKIKYVQLFTEALIPLLGFFMWDWGLYFILLFYFIDIITNEVFSHLKSKKIVEFKMSGKNEWIKLGVFSVFILFLSIFVIHLSTLSLFPHIDFIQQAINFWTYEELGVQQGYILVPILAFGGYQQYKMNFILPKKFRTKSIKNLWQAKIQASVVQIAFAGFIIGLSQFQLFPEWLYVIGIVVFVFLYQLRYKT